MTIEFKLIEENDRDTINNLLQFEYYDFCKYHNDDLQDNGKYDYVIKEKIIEEKHSYIILADNKIAGFMLISEKIGLKKIEEFWIYPKYRKGLFVYKVLIKFSKIESGLFEYLIYKDNDRWLKGSEYMFNKHPQFVEIVLKQEKQFLINSKICTFVRYVIKLNYNNDEK